MKLTYFSLLPAELIRERGIKHYWEISEGTLIREKTISNFLLGKKLPNYNQIRVLSNFFDVSADRICDTNLNDNNSKYNKRILIK